MYIFPHCPPQVKKKLGVFFALKSAVIHISTVPAVVEKNLEFVFIEKGAGYTHLCTALAYKKNVSNLRAASEKQIRVFICQKAASYTQYTFLGFNFPRKNEK
jgi:hypothetical protein